LVGRITDLKNEQIATRLSRNLMHEVGNAYTEERNPARAMELAETAFKISPSRSVPEANNIGYLYLSYGNYDEAKLWFQAAAQYDLDEDDRQLLDYNMGVLSALSGHHSEAGEHFRRAKEAAVKSEASCVYQLNLVDGKLAHEEIFDPQSLDSLAAQALDSLSRLDDKSSGD
jgi:tetratricopeptide (TPR) repeat protein